MEVIRCASGAEFLQRAEGFLVAHEAENCMPLGITMQLRLYPERIQLTPYLAVVENDRAVVGAAVMTPPMRLVLGLTESREALQSLAIDLQTFYMPAPGVTGALPYSRMFAEAWQAATGDGFQQGMAERIYQLTQVTHPSGVPGGARRAGGSERDLLIEWLSAFEAEAFGSMTADVPQRVDNYLEMSTRGLFLWEDGQPVSVAGFGGLTPHGARIGPVYTPRERRGHGYAGALTAWLSQHLLDGGRTFCCLYTDLANPTSNHIYQAIGYAPVCDVAEFRFTSAVP